jgi:hypothetical protein
MWSTHDNGADINWYEADSYCRDSTLAGYSDWRLPTEEEMRSLFFKGRKIDCGTWPGCHIHPPFVITQLAVWTSFRVGEKYAKAQYFTDGSVQPDRLEIEEKHRALCVRALEGPKHAEVTDELPDRAHCVITGDVWRFGEVRPRAGGGVFVSGYRGWLREDWIVEQVGADDPEQCREYCTQRWHEKHPNYWKKSHSCREGGRK